MINTTNTPAIAPLSAAELDKLEALARAAQLSVLRPGIQEQAKDYFALVHAMDANTVLTLIAQARFAAQPVVGKDAPLPPPRNKARDFEGWAEVYTSHEVEQIRRDAIVADRHARALAAPVAAQADTTERDGWNAAAKALAERAAGHFRNKNFKLQDECLQCASMLHDMKPALTRKRSASAGEADTTASVICERCQGSGEGKMMVGGGPDAYEIDSNCSDCGGIGEILASQAPVSQAVEQPADDAEDARRLSKFIDWYLNSKRFADIDPWGHVRTTTRDHILNWLDGGSNDLPGMQASKGAIDGAVGGA